MKKIVIIGGGPAGMMAAIAASDKSHEVSLLERTDSLGKKLLLTGKGRCNLTNMCDQDAFLERFGRNGRFLRDAFKEMFNQELVTFFKSRGLALNEERQKRIFPQTNKAVSVLNILIRELKKQQVSVELNTSVKNLIIADQSIKGVTLSTGKRFNADQVILATGGVSYPQTGTSKEGHRMSQQVGHTIVPLMPALVPLETRQTFVERLMGLTLKNIRLTFSCRKKKVVSDIGELLFTDFGISGPLVLTLSGQVGDLLVKGEVKVLIDLKPALKEEQIEKRLIREFQSNPRMKIKNLMKAFLPIKFAPVFLTKVGISLDKEVNQITAEERKKIVSGLKGFSLDIVKTRHINFAMVTKGGISLKEVNPKTMESRLVKNLFFAGEILDLAGDTGGFNLQAAFSTGYLAGQSTFLIK